MGGWSVEVNLIDEDGMVRSYAADDDREGDAMGVRETGEAGGVCAFRRVEEGRGIGVGRETQRWGLIGSEVAVGVVGCPSTFDDEKGSGEREHGAEEDGPRKEGGAARVLEKNDGDAGKDGRRKAAKSSKAWEP